VRRVGFEPTSP